LNKKMNQNLKSSDETEVNRYSKSTLSDHDYIIETRREQNKYLRKRDDEDNKTMSHFI